MELTPEERRRIYEEEKARFEAQGVMGFEKKRILTAIFVGCGIVLVVILPLIGYFSFSSPSPGSLENSQTLRAVKQRSCKSLIATYQSALERSFEVELNSLPSLDDLRRDWYKALMTIHVYTRDVDGHYRDPTDVVQDVVSKLSEVGNGDDRRRLEYVLLGSAMPLEARRKFEKVCVEAVF